MNALPSLTSVPTTGPARPAPPGVATGAASPADFLAMLFPGVAPVLPRQGDTAPGKNVPVAAADDDDPTPDIVVPAAIVVPTILPTPPLPQIETAPAVSSGGLTPTAPVAGPSIGAAPPAAPPSAPSDDAGVPLPVGNGSTIVTAKVPIPAPDKPVIDVGLNPKPIAKPEGKAPVQPILPAARSDAPATVLPPQIAQIAPAAQVFAAAIHQAARDEREPAAPAQPIALAAGVDLAAHAVAATHGVQHAAIDMHRETWPTKMIEQIEALRDAADAQDTSIRLVPDRLGTIDVSLKREHDRVEVHFAAAQPETRQLLADAQPRLTELAEARGLKLAANLADSGAGQSPPRQQPAAPPATLPAAARRADAPADTEQRIA